MTVKLRRTNLDSMRCSERMASNEYRIYCNVESIDDATSFFHRIEGDHAPSRCTAIDHRSTTGTLYCDGAVLSRRGSSSGGDGFVRDFETRCDSLPDWLLVHDLGTRAVFFPS